jgi:PadR family transcriptional regulator, regulatory protein PadR
MSERHDLIKSNIDSLLLCLMSGQPMYGYQIIKELKDRSQGYFNFKEGTLYPALHRLERSGLVEGKWKTLPSGQQRKYYYITEKGYASLAEKRSSWNEFLNAMNLIIQVDGIR